MIRFCHFCGKVLEEKRARGKSPYCNPDCRRAAVKRKTRRTCWDGLSRVWQAKTQAQTKGSVKRLRYGSAMDCMSNPVLNRRLPCGHFDLVGGRCLVCQEYAKMLKAINHERDPKFYQEQEGSAWWNT